ncbi:MAG: JAB domain-containing protein [Clostridia bacterium]
MDKNIKIIYNKLENIKLNQGYVDLSSSSIQNKNHLVDVCTIFRYPRYETFKIFYMKDNKIVGQEAITSKLPDGVFVFNEKTGDLIRTYEKMINRMKRLNADGYYLAHNHPSGIAKASKEDIKNEKFCFKCRRFFRSYYYRKC